MEGKQYVLDLGKPSPVDPFIEFPKMRYIGIKKELYNGLLEPGKIYTILEEKVYYHYTYYGILGGIGRIYNSTDFEFTNEVLSPMEYAVCKSIVFIKDEIEKVKENDRTKQEYSTERNFDDKVLEHFKAAGFKVNVSPGCYGEVTTFSW
jgi:hypothetical protein